MLSPVAKAFIDRRVEIAADEKFDAGRVADAIFAEMPAYLSKDIDRRKIIDRVVSVATWRVRNRAAMRGNG